MPILLLVFSVFVTSPSFAQEEIQSAITITEKECRKLIRLNTVHDADYTAGVDVHGKDVVSADLNGGYQIDLPEEITFDIGVDLAQKYNLGKGFYGKANLGKVKVRGRNVYWNGKKLQQSDNATVLEACLKQYGQN